MLGSNVALGQGREETVGRKFDRSIVWGNSYCMLLGVAGNQRLAVARQPYSL
jgi:hypothetical protein